MGPAFFDGGHKRLHKVVVLLAANPLVLPADIDRIIEQSVIVSAHIKQDRQAVFRRNPGQRGIERHFADGNSQPARALVSQSENALSVAHHDAAYIVIARVSEYLLDAILVGIAEEHPTRFAPYLAETLASFAYHRRIDNRQQLFNIVRNERVEKRLIVILQIAHQAVLAEGRDAIIE